MAKKMLLLSEWWLWAAGWVGWMLGTRHPGEWWLALPFIAVNGLLGWRQQRKVRV